MQAIEQKHSAALALSRSYGALFFSLFGACWLLLSFYAFGALRTIQISAISLGVLLLAGIAFRIQSQARKTAVEPFSEEQRRRDGRTFGIVNAVQWVTIFLMFTFFPKLGLDHLTFPAVLLVIGLHFFALPPSYRHTSNFVTGAVLVVWAVVCPLLWKGDRMIALIALGAGLTLWISAAWALAFATRNLRLAQA